MSSQGFWQALPENSSPHLILFEHGQVHGIVSVSPETPGVMQLRAWAQAWGFVDHWQNLQRFLMTIQVGQIAALEQ